MPNPDTPYNRKIHVAYRRTRRHMIRTGKVKVGDGKQIHHKDKDPHNSSSRNVVVVSNKKHHRLHTKSYKPRHT